jgi:hypothetical protein
MMPSPFSLLRSLAMPVALSILAGALLGCPGRTTTNQVSQTLNVQPLAGGYYMGFSGTTFSQSIPSGKQVHLLSATITSSSGDFSWASSLTGTGGDTTQAPVIVSKASFDGAGSTTDLDVVDTGDLLPLFPDQDFKVYWLINFTSALTQSYPNGVELTLTYELDVE